MRFSILALLLALVHLGAVPLRAQSPVKLPPLPAPVGAHYQLVAPKTTYAVGEPIVVTARFSTEINTLYVLAFGEDWLDRCFMPSFAARDELGAAVPLRVGPHMCFWTGGVPEQSITIEHPYEQKVVLNEWLAFDKPGKYTVLAEREVYDRHFGSINRRVSPLSSTPLTLEITLPDEAARLDLFERATKMPPGSDNQSRSAREAIMRELRLVGDERALPFLARGLLPGYFVAQHAELGLRNFPDAAKAKTALLKLLDTPGEPLRPANFPLLAAVLTDLDMRLLYPGSKPGRGIYATDYEQRITFWRASLLPLVKTEITRLPPDAAAEAIIEALQCDSTLAGDLALWQRVLRNAPLLTYEKQGRLGWLLLKLPHDAMLNPLIAQIAANTGLRVELRTGAVNALLLRDITAARAIIYRDLASPSPQFAKETQAHLGDYQPRARAALLIAKLRAAKDEKQCLLAAENVRDLAPGATIAELRAAYLWLLKIPRSDPLPIIEAIALQSPREGFAVLQDLLARSDALNQAHVLNYLDTYHAYMRVLTRLNLPEAHALVLKILRSGPADERLSLLRSLCVRIPAQWLVRGLPVSQFGRERYTGEAIELAQHGPSLEVRFQASCLLQLVTHLPAGVTLFPDHDHPASPALIAAWCEWWEKNCKRFR